MTTRDPDATQTQDERFMQEALKQAKIAFEKGEVAVGAVLVAEGRVLARGHNQVELLKDATAHAEMLCITAASSALENWRLLDATLYTTIEPCAMCAGALLLARVKRLVWGAPDLRHGANGSWIDLFAKRHPTHTVAITRGVLADQCGYLIQDFFQKRRKEKEQAGELAGG